jgi:hypothetical protein
MVKKMKPVDPLQLQRLTDGELSLEQIKQVIKNAESNPDQWPAIAKALIEDKLWQNQILQATQLLSPPVELTTPVSPPKHQHSSRWTQLLSVAAALAVAAVAGYLVAGMNIGGDPSPFNSTQLAESDLTTPMTPATFSPDYHLKFSENSGLARRGFSSQDQVPLYSIKNADELRQFQDQQTFEPVSSELLQKLTSAGYRINNNIELISGDFNDQQRFVVPIRTIQLEPSQ